MAQESPPAYISLFNKPCKFLLGVREYSTIPDFFLPEVAFWGKSNVGKSSLINALVNQKKLVKISNTPGKTKEINFFDLNKQLIIADLPGYGFSKVSDDIKSEWHYLVLDYFYKRTSLKRVFILIDSRHGLKPPDIEIMKFLDKVPKVYSVILTKIDKISTTESSAIKQQIESYLQKHTAAFPSAITTSSKNKASLDELKQHIFSSMI